VTVAGLSFTVLLLFAAFVIVIASLRVDRATEQSVSDMAAAAAAQPSTVTLVTRCDHINLLEVGCRTTGYRHIWPEPDRLKTAPTRPSAIDMAITV
jgi:hypothetical protein